MRSPDRESEAHRVRLEDAPDLPEGEPVVKRQSSPKRARKQRLSYVSESVLGLKAALNDTLARGPSRSLRANLYLNVLGNSCNRIRMHLSAERVESALRLDH